MFLLPSRHAQASDHRPQELASTGLHLSLPSRIRFHKCRERNEERITRRITHRDSFCFVLKLSNRLAAASSNRTIGLEANSSAKNLTHSGVEVTQEDTE
jgi:hypothetical protein